MAYCKNCGELIDDKAVICPHCGVSQQKPVEDNGGFGWSVLGFCIPFVGLILYLVWKDDRPKTSKAVGRAALISMSIFIVLQLLTVCGGMASTMGN